MILSGYDLRLFCPICRTQVKRSVAWRGFHDIKCRNGHRWRVARSMDNAKAYARR